MFVILKVDSCWTFKLLSTGSMGRWCAFMFPWQTSSESGIKSWWIFSNHLSNGWLSDTVAGDFMIKSLSPSQLDTTYVLVTPLLSTLFVPSLFYNSMTSSKWFQVHKVLIWVTKIFRGYNMQDCVTTKPSSPFFISILAWHAHNLLRWQSETKSYHDIVVSTI